MRFASSEGGHFLNDSRRPVKSRARTAACSSLCSCDMNETLPVSDWQALMIALTARRGCSDFFGGGGSLLEHLFEVREAAHHLLVDVVGLLVEFGDFQLGLDVHVVLDVGAHLVLLDLTVLADEDEAGEEDGFERDDHGEQAEGEGVEAARAVGVA